jgi:ribosomal protein L1
MIPKYANRSLPNISRVDAEAPDHWYNEFLKTLDKTSVQSQRSIHDDIAAIMGNPKSKYSNVEEAVQDMKERTGLKAFLTAKQAVAAIQEPEIFKTAPEMKVFIDNFVQDHPGTSVESVINDLLKINSIRNKMPDRSDVEDDVRVYINGKIAEVSSQSSDANNVEMHIGKVDQSSEQQSTDDPLAICEPIRY